MSQDLPVPDAIAQAHSQELTRRILEAASDAPLPMSTYMNHCLYEPGLGYYMAGSQKFGPGGDFITSPEVSPLFGYCLAEQCREILQICGGGVLELGAGSGRLALSIIQSLPDDEWSSYLIVEPSADLKGRQRTLLTQFLDEGSLAKVHWLDRLPETFTGVMLANEVMDALPVQRLIRTANGFELEAIGVAGTDSEPSLTLSTRDPSSLPSEASANLSAALKHIETDIGTPWSEGYRSEVSPMLSPWIKSLSDSLAAGALLLIDYGYPRSEYYLPERTDGTLQCFYRHHAHNDVTFWPGLQDITAHVDFTAVVEAGDSVGLSLLGYTSQASFLLGCGITEKASEKPAVWQAVNDDSDQSRIQNQQAINRLILPGEMGEKFQVMGLGRGIDAALKGFSFVDLSHRL